MKSFRNQSIDHRENFTNRVDKIISEHYTEDLDKYTDVNYLVTSMRRHEFIFKAFLGE